MDSRVTTSVRRAFPELATLRSNLGGFSVNPGPSLDRPITDYQSYLVRKIVCKIQLGGRRNDISFTAKGCHGVDMSRASSWKPSSNECHQADDEEGDSEGNGVNGIDRKQLTFDNARRHDG